MKRDFMKKHHARKRAGSPWVMWAIIGFALIASGCLLSMAIKKQYIDTADLGIKIENAKLWIVERRQHSHEQKQMLADAAVVAKKKSARRAVEDEVPVHFEFYTALPNMQMATADKVIAEDVAKSAIKEQKKNLADATSTKKTIATDQIFMNPDELEREFSKHIKTTKNTQ